MHDYSTLEKATLSKAIGLKEEHIPILVNSYIDESKSILQNLKAAISSNDYSNIALYAHSLKGSSGNLHLDGLLEQCKAMELAAKATDEHYGYMNAYNQIESSIATLPRFN